MGTMITLTADDGFRLGAYRADPSFKVAKAPRGIQEIFGVNAHIRSVCDGYAADGYVAIAPALFDCVERGVETGYSRGGHQRAPVKLRHASSSSWQHAFKDSHVVIDELAKVGKVGVVGYCFGGTMAWLAASSMLDRVAAANLLLRRRRGRRGRASSRSAR